MGALTALAACSEGSSDPDASVDAATSSLIVVTARELAVSESGPTTATFAVRLLRQPTAPVTIPVTTPEGDVTLSGLTSGAVVLTGGAGGNWEAGVTVTVTAVQDELIEGEEMQAIALGPAASDDRAYDGVAIEGVTVRITDEVAPLVATSEGSTAYTEQEPSVVVDAALTVGSPGVLIESATIVVESPRFGDRLTLEPSGPFEATDIVATPLEIVVTHDPPATAAEYQALLRTLRYDHTEDAPGPSRTLRITVVDTTGATESADKAMAITEANDGPALLLAGTVTTLPGAPAPIAIGIFDPDAELSPMRLTLRPANGTVTLTAAEGATVTREGEDWTIEGSAPALEATVGTARYTTSDPNGGTVTAELNDLGNTGIGGPLSDTFGIRYFVFPGTCTTTLFNGHRYYFCPDALAGTDARSACTSRASYPVVIEDEAEATFLRSQTGGAAHCVRRQRRVHQHDRRVRLRVQRRLRR